MIRYARDFNDRFRHFVHAFVVCAVLCTALGCRSSRKEVKQAYSEQKSTEKAEFATDSVSKSSKTTDKVRESEQNSGNFIGRVSFDCDATGDFRGISWEINAARKNDREGTYSRDKAEHAVAGSGSVKSSRSEESGAEETQKAETKVDATVPLEMKIGVAVMGLILLYLCYLRFKPWIRLILP